MDDSMTMHELKKIIKDIWKEEYKLIAFKSIGKEEAFYFKAIFINKENKKTDISIEIDEELKTIEKKITFDNEDLKEEIVVKGTKLMDKVLNILMEKVLKKQRLRIIMDEFKIINSHWIINLELYEKKWKKEDINSFKDELEDTINVSWSNYFILKNNKEEFTLIGETGRYLKELLCDEMMLMKCKSEKKGIYKFKTNHQLFSDSWFKDYLSKTVYHFLNEKKILVL